nr:Putative carbon-nitrogen hydrolase [uncultured bacterium]
MTRFAIAGIQQQLSAAEPNLERMSAKLDELMMIFPWVQMVVFSELAAHGPNTKHAQAIGGPVEDTFRSWARKHGIWLLPGSTFERADDDRIYNMSCVIDPGGEVVCRYRKMFPFRPYEVGVEAGDAFTVFDVPEVGRFGVSICYDMWFPETTRTLASLGAEVILHPTMTGTIDRDVELSIVRASAAQNQCFFFDINGLGDGGSGRSIIVGPDGDVLCEAGSATQLMPLEIDLDRVRHSRQRGLLGLCQTLKSFRDRRVQFDVYAKEPGNTEYTEYLDTLGPLEKPARPPRQGK